MVRVSVCVSVRVCVHVGQGSAQDAARGSSSASGCALFVLFVDKIVQMISSIHNPCICTQSQQHNLLFVITNLFKKSNEIFLLLNDEFLCFSFE